MHDMNTSMHTNSLVLRDKESKSKSSELRTKTTLQAALSSKLCIREHPGKNERSGGNFLMHFNGQNKDVLDSKFVWGPCQVIAGNFPIQTPLCPAC